MIQFNLSRGLAKVLSPHVRPAKIQESSMEWQADVVLIGGDACVVAQELSSHYVMVFCGLEKADFQRFPDLFRERFWRESVALCLQGTAFDQNSLITCLASLCDQQHYQLDPVPAEEGRLTQVIEKLESLFLHQGQPLPLDGKSAFKFGIEVNGHKSLKPGRAVKPSAMEAYRGLCLDLVESMIAQDVMSAQPGAEPILSLVISQIDNVVRVDFARNRKAS